MKDIVITFSDNSKKIYPAGITGMDIAQSISQSLAREALAIKVNDTLLDLERPIESDAKIQILTWEDREGKEVFWHSSAHIMAAAVFSLFSLM